MREKRIENLPPLSLAALARKLERRGLKSSVADLYWLPVPEHLLNAEQKAHAADCGPHVMALEISKTGLCLEFLVRARYKITCSCVAMADAECEAFMSAQLDSLLKELGVEP